MEIPNQKYLKPLFFFIIIYLSLLEFRLSLFSHADHINSIIQTSYYITLRAPQWKEFQNRLIGPFLVKIIAHITTFEYGIIYMYVIIALHIIKNLICFICIKKLTNNYAIALKYTIYSIFCFIAFLDLYWLYIWDYIDNIIFILFIYGVFSNKNNLYYSVLFIIALLNRESALFIPLWMIIDSIIHKKEETGLKVNIKLYNNTRLFLGTILLIGGIVFINLVREYLLIEETAAAKNIEFAMERPFHFLKNSKQFFENIYKIDFELNILVNIFLISIPILIIKLRNKMDDKVFKLTILFIIILISIILMGLINETRIYNTIIPFFIFLSLYFFGHIKIDN